MSDRDQEFAVLAVPSSLVTLLSCKKAEVASLDGHAAAQTSKPKDREVWVRVKARAIGVTSTSVHSRGRKPRGNQCVSVISLHLTMASDEVHPILLCKFDL